MGCWEAFTGQHQIGRDGLGKSVSKKESAEETALHEKAPNSEELGTVETNTPKGAGPINLLREGCLTEGVHPDRGPDYWREVWVGS